jgi:hypothetical protein
MSNAQILAILRGLSDVPRALAELLPGATRAEVREAADYLDGTGLADVRVRDGVMTSSFGEVERLCIEKARARGEC